MLCFKRNISIKKEIHFCLFKVRSFTFSFDSLKAEVSLQHLEDILWNLQNSDWSTVSSVVTSALLQLFVPQSAQIVIYCLSSHLALLLWTENRWRKSVNCVSVLDSPVFFNWCQFVNVHGYAQPLFVVYGNTSWHTEKPQAQTLAVQCCLFSSHGPNFHRTNACLEIFKINFYDFFFSEYYTKFRKNETVRK